METRGASVIIVILVLLVLGAGFLALGAFPPTAPRASTATQVIPTSKVAAD